MKNLTKSEIVEAINSRPGPTQWSKMGYPHPCRVRQGSARIVNREIRFTCMSGDQVVTFNHCTHILRDGNGEMIA